MRVRLIIGLSIGAVLALGATVVVWQVSRSESPASQLTVIVDGLPAGEQGKVLVSGPSGSYVLTTTDTRVVQPGLYKVRTEQARIAIGAAYGAENEVEIAVPAGGEVAVDGGYKLIIPDTTKVLPAGDKSIQAATPDSVTFAPGRAPQGLKVGHAIVGSVDAGLLVRKITGIGQPGADGVVVARTTTIKLAEALPAAQLSLYSHVIEKKAVVRPAFRDSTNSGGFAPWVHIPTVAQDEDPLFSIDTMGVASVGNCSASTPRLRYDFLGATLAPEGDFEWGMKWEEFKPYLAKLDVTIKKTLTHRVNVTSFGGTAGCSFDLAKPTTLYESKGTCGEDEIPGSAGKKLARITAAAIRRLALVADVRCRIQFQLGRFDLGATGAAAMDVTLTDRHNLKWSYHAPNPIIGAAYEIGKNGLPLKRQIDVDVKEPYLEEKLSFSGGP